MASSISLSSLNPIHLESECVMSGSILFVNGTTFLTQKRSYSGKSAEMSEHHSFSKGSSSFSRPNLLSHQMGTTTILLITCRASHITRGIPQQLLLSRSVLL